MQNGGSSFWAGTQHTDVRLTWTDYPISSSAGYDPMIGLMKALVGNPEATRELLTDVHDPADPMRLPRLDYLLTGRDWPTDTVPGPGQSIHTNPGIELFGAALEHAVAIDADERSYRIVEAIIYAVGNEASPESLAGGGDQQVRKHEPFPARDLVHEELRRHLGRIAAHYIEDLHWRADNDWGTPETLTAGDMRLTNVDPDHLKYFFAELGKDPSARNEIVAASMATPIAWLGYTLTVGTDRTPSRWRRSSWKWRARSASCLVRLTSGQKRRYAGATRRRTRSTTRHCPRDFSGRDSARPRSPTPLAR